MQTTAQRPELHPAIETRVLVVEFIGAFAITYISSWALIFGDLGSISPSGIALAHALSTLILMWFAVPISGGQFNPAITVGLLIAKHIELAPALFYLAAQFAGGIVAAGFIFIQLSPAVLERLKPLSVLGIPRPGDSGYEISGFWGEAIGTFVLMFAYLALVADCKRHQSDGIGAPAVAFAIYICGMTLAEISGAGLNPARALGPAIVSGTFSSLQFVHLFGPMIGSILQAVIYTSVFGEEEEEVKPERASKSLGLVEAQQEVHDEGEARVVQYEMKENH